MGVLGTARHRVIAGPMAPSLFIRDNLQILFAMPNKTRNKLDYVALNKPFIDVLMLVESCAKHRNHETNKGFIITLSVLGHKAQIRRYSHDRMRVGGFATLSPEGNLSGVSNAKAQKILAKEDNAFENAMSSIAVLAKTTQHNPIS